MNGYTGAENPTIEFPTEQLFTTMARIVFKLIGFSWVACIGNLNIDISIE